MNDINSQICKGVKKAIQQKYGTLDQNKIVKLAKLDYHQRKIVKLEIIKDKQTKYI